MMSLLILAGKSVLILLFEKVTNDGHKHNDTIAQKLRKKAIGKEKTSKNESRNYHELQKCYGRVYSLMKDWIFP